MLTAIRRLSTVVLLLVLLGLMVSVSIEFAAAPRFGDTRPIAPFDAESDEVGVVLGAYDFFGRDGWVVCFDVTTPVVVERIGDKVKLRLKE